MTYERNALNNKSNNINKFTSQYIYQKFLKPKIIKMSFNIVNTIYL